MTTPLRTGIVGSGFVARVHAAAVRDLGGNVVAVCSRTRAGADRLVAENRGRECLRLVA
jgi:predicted dehydrogenase